MEGIRRCSLLGMAQANNVKQLPWIEDHKLGKAAPVFEIGGFINTLEGWNLFARCRASGNMEPYETAKALYDQERRMNEARLCAEATR